MNLAIIVHSGNDLPHRVGEALDLDDNPGFQYEWEPNLIRMAEDAVLRRFRDCDVPVTEREGRLAWEQGLASAHLGCSLALSAKFSEAHGKGILSRTEYLDEMWRSGWFCGTHSTVSVLAPTDQDKE